MTIDIGVGGARGYRMNFSDIAGDTGVFVDGDWIEKKIRISMEVSA